MMTFNEWWATTDGEKRSYQNCWQAAQEAMQAKLDYANEVIEQRNAMLHREYKDFIQAVTDPENQPSQFGTVTLAMHEAAIAAARVQAINECKKIAHDTCCAEDSLFGDGFNTAAFNIECGIGALIGKEST